jgi:hypothetical protein
MKSINELDGQVKAFAIACFDTNSIEELQAPHTPADADSADMNTWGITADEWSLAIDAALLERLGSN